MDLSIYGSPEDFAWGLANDPNFLKTAAIYGISYADILNYIAPTVAPAPTPAPTSAPTPELTPAPTPEPTPAPTPAPTSAPTYEPPPTYTEPEPFYYEPPPRTPYNGYDFNSIVSQTQTRANQGFTPSELYNYAVYSLGFTGPEAQSILASVSFPKTAEQIEAERLAAEREAQRIEAERLAAEQAARDAARLEAERLAAQEAARLEAIRVENERIAEAQRVEAARLAAEEAARLEAARVEAARVEAARLEAQRIESERIAAEEAARQEALRVAEEQARLAAEEAARLAKEQEAARTAAEAARIAEQQRIAQEAAAKAAAELAAQQEAARLAEEAARKAAEDAAKAAADDAAKLAAEQAANQTESPTMATANLATLLGAGVSYDDAQSFILNYGSDIPLEEALYRIRAINPPVTGGYIASDGKAFDTAALRDAYQNALLQTQNSPTTSISPSKAADMFFTVFGRQPTESEYNNLAIAAKEGSPYLASDVIFGNYLLAEKAKLSGTGASTTGSTGTTTGTGGGTSISTGTGVGTGTVTETGGGTGIGTGTETGAGGGTGTGTGGGTVFTSITPDQAALVYKTIFGKDPTSTQLGYFAEAVKNKDPSTSSVEAFTAYLMRSAQIGPPLGSATGATTGTTTGATTGTTTGTNTGTTTGTTTTPTVLSEFQARNVFLNLFGRQPSATELANFLAAQSSTNPFVTPQSLESYLRGTDAYTKYLQGLQQPTTSGFSSVPQTFGGAFSVPVTPMAGPAYYEVGGSPIMESSAVAGPEIRRRTQQRLGEGFTREQLTNYAISQGLSPDVIKYAFGENVTLPGTIQTGLTPTFRSGAAGFTSMRPSSLEFGVPAVSQAVQQYTPGAFDKAALQNAYEQATGQTYGGENVDQMQQTGSWDGGKLTKDKIAYEKGGKVRGLLGPNPDNPDDGYGSLQVGEYVIRKKAVNKYGEDFLEALNESRLPKKKAKSLL